jgi:glycosyltransferase involved in cell wall biosynthesis
MNDAALLQSKGYTATDTPFFSLVIPTIARSVQVEALFESIRCSECQDLEVLVVDQNNDDRLVELCRRFSRHFSLRHCRVDFTGAARARNYGARYATGRILAFPDDDCELTPTLLSQAKELFIAKQVKVLIGICTDRLANATVTHFVADERPLTKWTMWGRHAEATMMFDRTTFLACEGFDEAFGVGAEFGSDEGPELLIRLLGKLKPGETFYSHRLRFFHPEVARNFSPAGISRSYSYARGSGALLAKWPTVPVYRRSLSLLLRAAVASLCFRGTKAEYYRARIKGFIDGFRAYRASAASMAKPQM